ncbi:MAG: ECF-type sigma factor [Pirellula sp.]
MISNENIAKWIERYWDETASVSDREDALTRLGQLILDIESRYLSRLVAGESDPRIDVGQLANIASMKFLTKYIIQREIAVDGGTNYLGLLKSIARSTLANAGRDEHCQCRAPIEGWANRIGKAAFDPLDLVEDRRPSANPSSSLEFAERLEELESQLNDENLCRVFRLRRDGYSTKEIAKELNWDIGTAARLVTSVRKALREGKSDRGQAKRANNQQPTTNNQQPTLGR